MRTPSVPVSEGFPPELRAFAAALREDPQSLNPDGRPVDWDDGPWPVKVYDGGVRLPLSGGEDTMNLGPLARLLALSFAISRVRFDPAGGLPATPSDPVPARHGPRFVTRRPIASGGSMYPTEAYVLLPGPDRIFHYDPWRHELTDLCHPAPGAGVRAALGLAAPGDLPSAVLLLASRFWKNCYKYGDFGYRLGAVDAGVALGRVVRLAAAEFGRADVRTGFADAEADACLGLDTAQESVYAIVGLGPAGPCGAGGPGSPGRGLGPGPVVLERSRSVLRSERFDAMHRAALCPQASEAAPFDAAPSPGRGSDPDTTAMVARTSNGKLFTGGPADAGAWTAVVERTAAAIADLRGATRGRLGHDVEVYCAVHRVEGVPAGWYRGTTPIHDDPDCARILQSALYAGSANVELGAFTLHIAGSVDYRRVRDFRELQLAVGAAIDAATVAATAAGLGSHPFLGFDARQVDAAYLLPAGRGVLAQVCVGRVRPDSVVEVTVRLA